MSDMMMSDIEVMLISGVISILFIGYLLWKGL